MSVPISFIDCSSVDKQEGIHLFYLIQSLETYISKPISLLLWLGPKTSITPLLLSLHSSRIVSTGHQSTEPANP